MKLPVRVLRIGPYDFKIEALPEESEDWGECDYDNHTIRLKDEWANRNQAAECALHECIHGLLYVSGYSTDDKEEERLVTLLSIQLASFIRDNPKFVAWLVKGLSAKR
jgi:hypothetical protein